MGADHELLKHVKFPPIHTLDTSKTPKAVETRIAAPVLASADIANITGQIQAIQATQDGGKNKSKRAAGGTDRPSPASKALLWSSPIV